MAPLPPACSGCRLAFNTTDPRRRLVVLEAHYALCSECEWSAGHPEARTLRLGRALQRRRIAA